MTATDDELVARVTASGDERAYAQLVQRHQGVVRGMLTRMTRAPAQADDLAQETFLQAYRKIDTYTGSGSFRGWICRIAYTQFLMARRKSAADARLTDALTHDPAAEPDAPGWDRGDAVDLDRALAGLSEAERVCVVLCYACGMSHGEAAQTTGMPLGTVKSHVNRGRAKLKSLLAAEVPA